MRRVVVIVILCLLFCAIYAQDTTHKDWAKFGRYEQANLDLKKAPRAIFYGNSITDFWVNNDSVFFADNQFVDRGVSGQTTSEMLVRFRQDVINLKPKAVVIMAGINDMAHNNGMISQKNILGNIISMAELAKVNKIKVILCSVLPCDRFKWRPELKPAESVKSLNVLIKRYAQDNNIPYLDYYTTMATPDGAMKPELTKDGCHPTLAGYKVMEPLALEIINKVVK